MVKSSKKEIEPNKKISSLKESKENNTIIKGNINKKIAFEEKIEKAFVKGDIIHNVGKLEMLVRKINKSSQKITINLYIKPQLIQIKQKNSIKM